MGTMRAKVVLIFSLFINLHLVFGKYGHEDPSENILSNWNFHSPNLGWSNWFCDGNCLVDHYTGPECRDGSTCGLVHSRSAPNAAVRNRGLNMDLDTVYHFAMFVKFLEPVTAVAPFRPVLVTKAKLDGGSLVFEDIAYLPFTSPNNDLYLLVSGDVRTPATGFQFVEFYLKDVPTGIEYLVDTASLFKVPADPNWQATIDARIQATRTTTVNIYGSIPEQYDHSQMEIKVIQKRHEFAFGTAVNAWDLTETGTFENNYQNYVYDNFEWATFENALKWRQMEWTQGSIDYTLLNSAFAALEQRGIPIRGHCVGWADDEFHPPWVMPLVGQDLLDALTSRIDSSVTHFAGRLAHWDVYNEDLAAHFYEEATGDDDIILSIFDDVNTADTNAKLFLNEFNVQYGGYWNAAYHNLVQKLQANGAPLYGIGIQAHHFSGPRSMEALEQRLDILAELGLPMWITELTVHNSDVTARAQLLDQLLRLYFSYDLIEGILLWGFSSENIFDVNAALTEGEACVNNEAGVVWETLVKNEWTTNESFQPPTRHCSFSFSGFHGDYDLEIYENSQLVRTETFQLTKGETVKDIYLQFC